MGGESRAPRDREVWPDVAKGLGIALMYYGHVLADLPAMPDRHASAFGFEQMRFIYAFHMPLFFMMAGFFYRPSARIGERLRRLALRRLVPVLFFGLLMLPFWAQAPLRHGLPAWDVIEPMLEGYLRGHPDLNWVTWFLVCLFTCEAMAMAVLPHLRSTAARALAGVASLWIGVVVCNHIDASVRLFGIEPQTWFIYEAIVALGFYLLGNALYPTLQALAQRPRAAWVVSGTAFAIAALTYRWNNLPPELTVMMSDERQGDPFAFALTAVAGSIAVMALAMALPHSRHLQRVGQVSLVLLGLSGTFYHFVNPVLLSHWPPPDSTLWLTVYTSVLAAVSLLLAHAAAQVLLRWLPQLLGHSDVEGPWLHSLETHERKARI